MLTHDLGRPALPVAERLRFREMTTSDLDDIASLLGDERVMRFYPRPKTRPEALAWIEWSRRNYARDGFGLWVIEDLDGSFVGDCGLTWQMVDGQEELEVGYHIVPERQGAGLATEGAAACRDFAAERGIPRLIAITNPENVPSQRVAEKIGMTWERSTTTPSGVAITVHGMGLHSTPSASTVLQ
ncbi:GNAT family N-acetyltransferase [Nocardioides sp. NPDC057767]|uniref:GNAT family N-acetyltransferase n=1 Tax=unclassified Nocardioides TaxID=2615069 RepID=UPI00366B8AF9